MARWPSIAEVKTSSSGCDAPRRTEKYVETSSSAYSTPAGQGATSEGGSTSPPEGILGLGVSGILNVVTE